MAFCDQPGKMFKYLSVVELEFDSWFKRLLSETLFHIAIVTIDFLKINNEGDICIEFMH